MEPLCRNSCSGTSHNAETALYALVFMYFNYRVIHENCICRAHSNAGSTIITEASVNIHLTFNFEFNHLITHFMRSYMNDRARVAIIISISYFCLVRRQSTCPDIVSTCLSYPHADKNRLMFIEWCILGEDMFERPLVPVSFQISR